MNFIKKVSMIILFFLVVIPVFTSAQTKLAEPTGPGADRALVTCGGENQDPCNVQDAVDLIQNSLNLVFMFAGFIVAAMFMYAGFLLITSVGDPGQIQKAKNIFKRTVVGFIIMFLSFILVKNLLTNIGADKFFIDIISGDKNTSSNTISNNINNGGAINNDVADTENLSNYFANFPDDYQSIVNSNCLCGDDFCPLLESRSNTLFFDTFSNLFKRQILDVYAQTSIQSGTQKVIDSMKKYDLDKKHEVFAYVITYTDNNQNKTMILKPKLIDNKNGTYSVNVSEKQADSIVSIAQQITHIDSVHTHPYKFIEKHVASQKGDLLPPSLADVGIIDYLNRLANSIDKKVGINNYVVESNGVWAYSAKDTKKLNNFWSTKASCTLDESRFKGSTPEERRKNQDAYVKKLKELGMKIEFIPNQTNVISR